MSLNIPPAVNYPSPLVAVPVKWDKEPPEGSMLVNLQINWGTMGGANNCINVNMQNNATLNFSQIVALSVDNSQCAADITFVFPDTGETTTIPGYEPKVIVPVFTNQTQFFIQSPSAQPEDSTNFSLLNTLPPPITVPVSEEQETVSFNNLAANGATAYTLIPGTVSGTVEGIHVLRTSPTASAGFQTFVILDGNSKVISGGQFDIASATADSNVVLLNLNPMHVRFNDGLFFDQGGVDVGGAYCVTILYRTP